MMAVIYKKINMVVGWCLRLFGSDVMTSCVTTFAENVNVRHVKNAFLVLYA